MTDARDPDMTGIPRAPFWKVWLILTVAGLIGVLAILPYALAVQGDALNQAVASSGVPLSAILAIQVVQNGLLVAGAAAAGLWAARRIGLDAPMIEALAAGRPVAWAPRTLAIAAGAGAAAALLVLALDAAVFGGLAGVDDPAGTAQPGPLPGLLASVYGGITEEILLRLFLLSLLALGLHAIATRGRPGARPLSGWAFWTANLGAAVLFGLGHLPATAALVPLTGAVVARAIVLNGLIGVLCGALFRRFGLEWAILAHFSADIVLHVIFPLLLG